MYEALAKSVGETGKLAVGSQGVMYDRIIFNT
jgi:hypothetical protein